MSLRFGLIFRRNPIPLSASCRILQTTSSLASQEFWWGPEKAAGREIVGHGPIGEPIYQDRLDYWYPAIRFRKDDDIIKPIKEKEKLDWKKLTKEEKKLLYRYSFRQTLAEFEAPTGYWKVITSGVFMLLAVSLLYLTFLNHYVYPPSPGTIENEFREAMLEKHLILNKGIPELEGYDYEKKQWTN